MTQKRAILAMLARLILCASVRLLRTQGSAARAPGVRKLAKLNLR
jgi:hypothetical protein